MMARILLVDDTPKVRESIKDALESAGFEVDEAPDGLVAIEFLNERPYTLLITDLWMPEVDGLDLMKHLRKINSNMPVIAITGGAIGLAPPNFSVALAESWGADAMLDKPFDNDDLVDIAKDLIAKYADKGNQ